MLLADVFDAEVVDDKGEGDGACDVSEETGSVFGGDVALGGEMFLEAMVGKDASLWKAIHAFADFHLDHVVVDEVGQLVLEHDVGRDVFDWNPHVFELCHGRVQIEILDVDGHVFGTGSGEDAVEVGFDGGEVGSGSRDLAMVDDLVAADGEADAVHLGFVQFESGDNAKVSGNSIVGFVCVFDEVHGVGP